MNTFALIITLLGVGTLSTWITKILVWFDGGKRNDL